MNKLNLLQRPKQFAITESFLMGVLFIAALAQIAFAFDGGAPLVRSVSQESAAICAQGPVLAGPTRDVAPAAVKDAATFATPAARG